MPSTTAELSRKIMISLMSVSERARSLASLIASNAPTASASSMRTYRSSLINFLSFFHLLLCHLGNDFCWLKYREKPMSGIASGRIAAVKIVAAVQLSG